ncbi:MAG: acyl-CoA thioesterase [Lachnospiraceae bacterium]|nr:acyl-CoA thioesterase [Lachnospiraceae bacterium]
MIPYEHKVQYYETDKMGIVHHSNYIRWMEEARVDFLEQIGWGMDRLEALGLISPVTGVECKYKVSTRFPEKVTVRVGIEEFRGVKLKIKYAMYKEDGTLAIEGHSEHGFLDTDGKIISVKKEFPECYEALMTHAGGTFES